MKIFSLALLFSLMIPFHVKSQVKQDWKVIKYIKKKAHSISTDRLGNLYIIESNNIWLYNTKGDSIAAFNSRKYGDISHVDTTDPYKILVFFQDYGIILFLDNYLSQNGDPIDLQQLGYDQVVMACQSRSAGFWIFDQVRQKVYHLNDELEVTYETVNLAQWFQKRIMPNSMIEFNNQLYVNEKESGIYIFDHFATYQRKIALKDIERIQLLENRINYVDSLEFCEYEIKSFETRCSPMPNKNVLDARVEKNRFYTLLKDRAIIYKTN